MRYFFKQLLDKSMPTQVIAPPIEQSFPSRFPEQFDRPSPNGVMKKEEINEDFNEQSMLNLPTDVKLEVEGGDAFIPPGFNKK